MGSVAALSDSGGNIVECYEYDIFGQPDTISSVGNPYMFTGRRYDTETALYYCRARYYEPYIGRFLQTDPIGYEDGLNLYTYVGNNPVNVTDPMGKLAKCPAEEPVGNPVFCKDEFPNPFYRGLECYREVVPEGSVGTNPVSGLWPSGNQCCYSKRKPRGEFCEQSPDFVAPATGGGGGTCEMDECRMAAHITTDVIIGGGLGIELIPKDHWPPAPPVGKSCPDKYKRKVRALSVW